MQVKATPDLWLVVERYVTRFYYCTVKDTHFLKILFKMSERYKPASAKQLLTCYGSLVTE